MTTYETKEGYVIITFFDGCQTKFKWGHLTEMVNVIKELIKGHEDEYNCEAKD